MYLHNTTQETVTVSGVEKHVVFAFLMPEGKAESFKVSLSASSGDFEYEQSQASRSSLVDLSALGSRRVEEVSICEATPIEPGGSCAFYLLCGLGNFAVTMGSGETRQLRLAVRLDMANHYSITGKLLNGPRDQCQRQCNESMCTTM
uniref:Uncharacterized protein n=1 Tax=Lotharella oceanica TaxID=641309 RepID=A0A7S2XJJ0_9EUKA